MAIIRVSQMKRLLGVNNKPFTVTLSSGIETQMLKFATIGLARCAVKDFPYSGWRYEIFNQGNLITKGKTGLYCFGGGERTNLSSMERTVEQQYGSGKEPVRYIPAISDSDIRNAKKAEVKLARQVNMTFHTKDHEATWMNHNSGRANVDQYDLRGLRKIWARRNAFSRVNKPMLDGRNAVNIALMGV